MKKLKMFDIRILDSLNVPENKTGLTPTAMCKLPIGSVQPEGWLKRQLEIELNGIPGQLWKHSPFLAEGNGWLNPEKTFPGGGWSTPLRPWEEQTCWLRTFIKLAVLTQDPESLSVAKRYLDVMLDSRQADGWFGPQSLRHFHSEDPDIKAEIIDIWPHMVVLEGILSWYEYTNEKCWLDLIHGFLKFCDSLPENELIPVRPEEEKFIWMIRIQYTRACDMLAVINRVIDLTGDESLTSLSHKLFRKWRGASSEFLTDHTVHFAQLFAYGAIYSRVSHQAWHRMSADYWYNQHMAVWGTLPRGAFCADETCRVGCTDPRYATESCTWAELTRSFNYLGELNAEPVWADRTEDVIFNHYPAAYTEDMKGLHYLTACNQVMLDDYKLHNVANKSHTFAYSATCNRCCLHNAGLAWPLFAEYLMTGTSDHGVCAWLYSAFTAKMTVGKDGIPVTWECRTDYPFRHEITFTLKTGQSTEFPFYLRIPCWCKVPVVKVNGKTFNTPEASGKLVCIERKWDNGDLVTLSLPAEITLSRNPRNGGITVDRGPFSYSLQIPEHRQKVVTGKEADCKKESGRHFRNDFCLPAKETDCEKEIYYEAAPPASGSLWTEILPAGPWNYGLMPEKGFLFEEHPIPADYVFVWDKAPMTIRAYAKRIPAWKLQDHMCAPLQNSPIRSSEKEEIITLIPLGCARLRLSVFPEIGDTPGAREWQEVPEFTPEKERPDRPPVSVDDRKRMWLKN